MKAAGVPCGKGCLQRIKNSILQDQPHFMTSAGGAIIMQRAPLTWPIIIIPNKTVPRNATGRNCARPFSANLCTFNAMPAGSLKLILQSARMHMPIRSNKWSIQFIFILRAWAEQSGRELMTFFIFQRTKSAATVPGDLSMDGAVKSPNIPE